MSRARFARIAELFAAASGMSEPDRAAFLDAACEDDPALRAEVDELLAHDERPHRLLAAAERAVSPPPGPGAAASLPRRIGRYRIRGVLGYGGMGIVYRAEQERPRRDVALKVIRPGLVSAEARRRFEREAEFLGRLRHPGIARIIEAGTAPVEGVERSFFAMELIEGRSIVECADEEKLTRRARLELMVKVCAAVQHAHDRQVIHRDLKPSNIVVDGHGEPRVLDFGIARAVRADARPDSRVTVTGEIVGTIPYMSPEQIAGGDGAIDARADVYALGVICYELLAGRRPHDVADLPLPEAARIICDDDPTPLSSVDRSLRGDLETIVGKCIARSREQRYPSAAALAADLERHLRDEPIVARPPSNVEQIRRFARRHRTLVTGVSSAFVVLLAGTIVSVHLALEASRERDQKEHQREEAEWNAYVANIAAAEAGLVGHRTTDAARHLAACSPDARGWEWHHLVRRLDRSRTTYRGHSPRLSVKDAVFLPRRGWMASVSDDASVQVWDAGTAATIHRFARPEHEGHTGWVHAVAADPAERFLASASEDGTVRIWDLEHGRLRRTIEDHDGPMRSVAWSADGTWIATASARGHVVLRRVPGFDVITRLDDHGEYIETVAIAPDDLHVAAGGARRLTVWDAATWERTATFDLDGSIYGRIDFSPDGERLAVGLTTGAVQIRRVTGGPPVAAWTAHEETVYGVCFSPEGDVLATAGGDRTARLWDVRTQRALRTLTGHAAPVRLARFHPDGSTIVTVANDGTARLWSSRADDVRVLRGHSRIVRAVAFSRDGRRLASAGGDDEGDGTVRVWDVAAGEERSRYVLDPPHSIIDVGFSPDGESLALSPEWTAALVRWDPATGAAQSLPLEQYANTVGFDATGARLVVGLRGDRGSIVLGLDGTVLRSFPGDASLNCALFSVDGAVLVTTGPDGTVVVRGADDYEVRATLRPPADRVVGAIRALAAGPDGRLVAASYGRRPECDLVVWDASAGSSPRIADRRADTISSLSFDPDGSRLILGQSDGTLRLWDVPRGRYVATLHGHRSEVLDVAFGPRGRWVASAARDGTIRLWDGRPSATAGTDPTRR